MSLSVKQNDGHREQTGGGGGGRDGAGSRG